MVRATAEAAYWACRQRSSEQRLEAIAARAPARRLAKAILDRGWRMGLPQLSVGAPLPLILKPKPQTPSWTWAWGCRSSAWVRP